MSPTHNLTAAHETKINLIPPRESRFSDSNSFLGWAVTVGRYLLIFTELLLFCAFLSRFYFDDRIQDEIDQGIKPKVVTINSLKTNQDNFISLQSRLNTTDMVLSTRIEASKVLDELNRLTPAGIRIKHVLSEKGVIKFSGNLTSVEDLEIFKNRFATSSVFSTLDITTLTTSKDSGTISFEAVSNLKTKTTKVSSSSAGPT